MPGHDADFDLSIGRGLPGASLRASCGRGEGGNPLPVRPRDRPLGRSRLAWRRAQGGSNNRWKPAGSARHCSGRFSPARLKPHSRQGLERAIAPGENLRLRLRLGEVPELSLLPWEYLFDPDKGTVPMPTSHLDRALSGAGSNPSNLCSSAPPLRVLVVHPRNRRSRSRSRASRSGRISSRPWKVDCPAAIQTRIEFSPPYASGAPREGRKGPCQILHFSVMALWRGAPGGGLIFEDEQGLGVRVDASASAPF